MAVIPYKQEQAFVQLPSHTPILCVIKEAELVNEPDPFGESADARRDVVRIVMDAVDDKYLSARIWFKPTASTHSRSRLLPFIQSCFPEDLTTDALRKFDTDTLVGRRVMVVGEYDSKDSERRFLRPVSFLRAPLAEAVTSRPTTAASPTTTPKPAAVTVPDDALDF